MRAISRMTGVSINTVTKLLEDAGEACIVLHDEKVRDVKAARIQCDEIWSFNYCKKVKLPTAKAAPVRAGDVWMWTALDSDSKMILSYYVGDRDGAHALEFIGDLASRIADRPQITTDGDAGVVLALRSRVRSFRVGLDKLREVNVGSEDFIHGRDVAGKARLWRLASRRGFGKCRTSSTTLTIALQSPVLADLTSPAQIQTETVPARRLAPSGAVGPPVRRSVASFPTSS